VHAGAVRRALRPAVLLLAGAAALALAGCHTTRAKEDMANPDAIYRRAANSMANGDFGTAVKAFEALNARFPFSDAARQSRLDLMYAYYRQREKDSAVDAADTFIRENPTHPRIDYAYYIKGLVYFERSPNAIERYFDVDMSKRPPQDLRKSFDAFARVITQYPHSEYALDAHQRMVYLRNRLAEYEIHVARYYIKRGAWVAALDRAKTVIETYDGAPATRDALEVSVTAYQRLGLADLAADSQKVLAANFPNDTAARRAARRHWWQFW
jgi:outer membrane protein assembly factor BamD